MERSRDTAGGIPPRQTGRGAGREDILIEERVGRGQPAAGAAPVPAVPDAGRAPERSAADPLPSVSSGAPARGSATGGPRTTQPAPDAPIGRVRAGMTMVDAAGEELGTVADVKLGNPGRATSGAGVPGEHGLAAALLAATGEPYAPEPLRSRLLRLGYVKVGGKGRGDPDRYLTADLIGRLAGDTVWLTVRREELPGGGA